MAAGPGNTTIGRDNKGMLPEMTVTVPFVMLMMSYTTTLSPAVKAKVDALMVMLA